MPLEIPVPNTAWSEVIVTLAGLEYTFEFRFNERLGNDEGRWTIDLKDADGNILISGLTLIEDMLLFNYTSIGFDHGDVLCLRSGNTEDIASRYNTGFGKDYILLYLTNEEIQDYLNG